MHYALVLNCHVIMAHVMIHFSEFSLCNGLLNLVLLPNCDAYGYYPNLTALHF